MRPSSSSDAIASARISLSVNSLNFLSMGTSSRFVEEENRTNGRKKSPRGRNRRLLAAQPLLAARSNISARRNAQAGAPVLEKLSRNYHPDPLNQKALRPAKMHNPEA